MKNTHVTTFGYEYGPPPDHVDRVYDVRDLLDFPFDDEHELDAKAQEILNELEPGDNIAIGCTHGHDRSAHIAKLIENNFGGVIVEHRDYGKLTENEHAATEGEKQGDRRGEHSRTSPLRLQTESGGRYRAEQGREKQEA